MHTRFVEQSEQFKTILSQEKEAFNEFITKMNAQFSAQISHMPQMAKQLEEISSIPVRLDKLIDKIEKSNAKLASDISDILKRSMQMTNVSTPHGDENGNGIFYPSMPTWMKWIGISSLVIIAAACIFNVVIYFIPRENPAQSQLPPIKVETVKSVPSPERVDTIISGINDTIMPGTMNQ